MLQTDNNELLMELWKNVRMIISCFWSFDAAISWCGIIFTEATSKIMLTLKTVILGIKINGNLEVGLGCSGQEPRLALLDKTPTHGKGEERSGAGEVQKVTFSFNFHRNGNFFYSFWKIWSFEFDFLWTVWTKLWLKQLQNYQSKEQTSWNVFSVFATLCSRMDPHSGESPTWLKSPSISSSFSLLYLNHPRGSIVLFLNFFLLQYHLFLLHSAQGAWS